MNELLFHHSIYKYIWQNFFCLEVIYVDCDYNFDTHHCLCSLAS